jgi:hypothetical protein
MSAANTSAIRRLADATGRRLTYLGALFGAAVGVATAAVMALRHVVYVPLTVAPPTHLARIGADAGLMLLCAAIGAMLGWWWRHRQLTQAHDALVSQALEAAVPHSRNLLRTALELEGRDAPRTDVGVAEVVRARANALAATVPLSTALSARVPLRRLGAALGVWGTVVLLMQLVPVGTAVRSAKRAAAVATQASSIARVDVSVTPPAYAQQPATALRDPQRVDALEGSALRFQVASNADSLRVETVDSTLTLRRPSAGDFSWTLPLRADGFVALTPFTSRAGPRRLVALTMQRDGAPAVRITAPGKDLIVPTNERTLDVRIDASDDVALTSLQLHYTKVSGSGERFEFTEGTIPVRVTRTDRSHWLAGAALALKGLLVEPGDVVVYRARATDARPGREPVESDAFIAQLAEAGGVAALGFSMDPDEDRYAVSQQMVIQKTERLIAGQRALVVDTVKERAAQIAVEQRRVRAEFVFMTGGEFEAGVVESEEGGTELDESAEAESEQDLAAGRMVNRGRQALLIAIRSMSRASLALTENRLADALRYEKTALTNLQEAFARQRFLMRALSQREALDPARRHTGAMDSLARTTVPTVLPERQADRDALRAVLAALLSASDREPRASGAAPSTARDANAGENADTELAMRVLQVSASRPDAQRIARWLTQAASARPASARVLRDSAAVALTTWLAAEPRAERAAPAPALAAQRRALQGGTR